MTTPFHPLDVEAAAKAIDVELAKVERITVTDDEAKRFLINVILTAAIASAKARGAAREGFDVEYISTSRTSPVREIKFKTLIIRMEE